VNVGVPNRQIGDVGAAADVRCAEVDQISAE